MPWLRMDAQRRHLKVKCNSFEALSMITILHLFALSLSLPPDSKLHEERAAASPAACACQRQGAVVSLLSTQFLMFRLTTQIHLTHVEFVG